MSTDRPDFCPYRGLLPYDAEYERYFFGRENEIDILISNLYTSPLTIFYGGSGVGKTSVLLAGVLPRISRGRRVAAFVFRDWQNPGVETALKQAALDAVTRVAGPLEIDFSKPLDEFFAVCASTVGGPLFVILDQFEEYFLYHSGGHGFEGLDADFARAINRDDIDVNFLLVMREDGLSRVDRFHARVPNVLGNLIRLENLGREEAARAIREPLAKYNEEFRDPRGEIRAEEKLVEAILGERIVFERLGKGEVRERAEVDDSPELETPFLQMVLIRLWDVEKRANSPVLRLSTFRKLGGANKIIREHLDDAMKSLNYVQRLRAASIFHHLVTPSGSKIAHSVGDLSAYTGLKPAAVEDVLKQLANEKRVVRSIVPPSGPATGVKYEISHDVLAPAVLDWRARQLEAVRSRRMVAITIVIVLAVLGVGVLYALYIGDARDWVRYELADFHQRAVREGAEEVTRSSVKSLQADDAHVHDLDLAPGFTYLVKSACDLDCMEVGVDLLVGGRSVRADTASASLVYQVPKDTTYQLQLRMHSCVTARCFYGYSVYRISPELGKRKEEEFERRLNAARNLLVESGYSREVSVHSTTAEGAASKVFPINLRRNAEYAFATVCDSNCGHAGFALERDEVFKVTGDQSSITHLAAPEGGTYLITLRLENCAALTCRAAVLIHRKRPQAGRPAPSAR